MSFQVEKTYIEGVLVLTPKVFKDQRGEFFEAYNSRDLKVIGLPSLFVQDNYSISHRGVIRGLHYQTGNYEQDKLVRCTSGAIFDVALDLRAESPTFGRWFGIELSFRNRKQLFIPKGCAHGLQALEEGSQACYKITSHYAPDFEYCINPLDPTLKINWPIQNGIILSSKDAEAPSWEQVKSSMTYNLGMR